MIKLDIQYFGSIHYVQNLMKHKNILFDHNAFFTKMSFKNRMVIMTSQGPLLLTIPIIGGRDQKTPLQDIFIAYHQPWREQHFKSIKTNYKKSPYFEFYEQSLHAMYLNKPEKLVDFLILCFQWMQSQLKVSWEIMNANEQTYLSNEQKYMDPWLPNNYNQLKDFPEYHQVFSDKVAFEPNLSILDMLFNVGAKEISKLWAPPAN